MSAYIIRIFIALGMSAIVLLSVLTVSIKMYHRTTSETAFVRNGMGGQRIFMSGGSLVLPVLHSVTPVSLESRKMVIRNQNNDAIRSLDGTWLDIETTLWIRVHPSPDGVAKAARSFGSKTLQPAVLKELIEQKIRLAIRSVIANRPAQDAIDQSHGISLQIETALNHELWKNGLQVETLTMTATSPKLSHKGRSGKVIPLFT
ncbi:MAG: hypothetical protein Alpg2KO_02910 [Alphaproteobacteria bacterium]